jgi:hypothetical protein
MKKERFSPIFRWAITTFGITAQQPVGISTSGKALVKLGPLSNTIVKTASESVNKRLSYM